MKKSHKYLYSLLGTIAGLVFCFAVVARVGLSDLNSNAEQPPENLPHESELSDFSQLDINGFWKVEIIQGDEWQVQTNNDNKGVKIQAYVRGKELVLKQKSHISFWNGKFDFNASATIQMPTLEKLDISGASQVEISGFEGQKLEVDVSGAAELIGENSRYETFALDSSGASGVNFEDVTVTSATIDMSGAANLILTMNGGNLSGEVSGAGNIKYYGTVASQNIETSGAANVSHAGQKK